jgi:hypothetical protein
MDILPMKGLPRANYTTRQSRVIDDGKNARPKCTHSGEGDDKSGEIVLNVETFHNTTVDLFNGSRAIAGDVPVISEGVQGRFENISKIANQVRRMTYGKVHGDRGVREPCRDEPRQGSSWCQ